MNKQAVIIICTVCLYATATTTAWSQEGSFVKLEALDTTFRYDMRYATANNFLKEKVYKCADCIIREEVARSLIQANNYFKTKGLRIKFYDCYRPLDVQKKMWEVMPNSSYVANPKYGSIHNRGGAVDITLVDQAGKELDMGTDFDYFGEKAHHAYSDLPAQVIENRKLLKVGMMKFGFTPIRSEWWHYNFGTAKKYAVSNFQVECQ
ncbi:M15 family metallopeptidase [Reichenbachiella versicolor]|uniref:M15 family metallopeptidase n=1 Tax=Reichenbachiella versicolor TaxID=1821036 RepID=UPI000D6DE3AB|nr:M15 family metallopeptidase [Reichenbachiella versicolor]